MMKSSLLCGILSTLLVPSLATTADGSATATVASKVEAKDTTKSYSPNDPLNDELTLRGLTGMTYTGSSYSAMTDTAFLTFAMSVDADNKVTVSSTKAAEIPAVSGAGISELETKDLEDVEYVKSTDKATSETYYLFASAQDVVLYQASGTAASIKSSFKILADGSTAKIGSIAALSGADTQYLVYSSQVGLGTDSETGSGCDKKQCLRLYVNSITITADTPTITELYQLRYDLETDGALNDIALFETADKVLYAVILESNRKLYFVKLSGDGAEKDGAKDVSKCEKFVATATDTCKADALKTIEKTELYEVPQAAGTTIQTVDVLYRDDKATLLDSNKKVMLVVTNNNAADGLDDENTNLSFLALDTTELISSTTDTTTSSTEKEEESKNAGYSMYRSASFVTYSCVVAAFYKFIAN